MRGPPTRRMRAPGRESTLHFSVAAFMRRAWPEDLPWWHTPNGELRDKRTAAKLKGMGVLRGVPDIIVLLPNGQAGFIELKKADGTSSDDQVEFRDKVLALHCGYATCRSMEEVQAALSRWLGMFGRKLRASIMRRAA